MKTEGQYRRGLARSLVGLGAFAGIVLAAAPAALASISGGTACTTAALQALKVDHVTIASATDVPDAGGNPEFCNVLGTLATTGEGAPDGSANFRIQLPVNWNHKVLVLGDGGFAGNLSPATNASDFVTPLPKGYATAISDTGHQAGGTDARWALKPDGTPDEAKLTDYFFRATHQFTIAAKQLEQRFFNRVKILKTYLTGCSNGGRMALVEATRFPDDFDGIIAGDPFMSIRSIAAGAKFFKRDLTTANFLPFTLLPLIDQATIAACDAVDGVKDGLIQNPGACSFDPRTLQCKKGQTSNCLTEDQVETLNAYFSAAKDDDGKAIYTGSAISDLSGNDGAALWTFGFFLPGQPLPKGDTQPTFDVNAPEPWGNFGFSPAPLGWQFVDHALQFIVERNPGFNLRDFTGANGAVSDAALNLFDARTEAGDGDDPAGLEEFLEQDKKLLIYHGFSDPALNAFRSIVFYEGLAHRHGGVRELQENARLFLVPGMHHCIGGPGPNVFDTLTALENWVEKGEAPDGIIATKFVNDNPAQGVARTMPLCKFPEEASFLGNAHTATTAEILNAANWTCSPHDERLLEVGANGEQAGLGLPQAAENETDRGKRP